MSLEGEVKDMDKVTPALVGYTLTGVPEDQLAWAQPDSLIQALLSMSQSISVHYVSFTDGASVDPYIN